MRRAAFLLVLVCVACSDDAPDPQFIQTLAKLDADFQAAVSAPRRAEAALAYSRIPDMRGRTLIDDFEQWLVPAESRAAIRELRERAIRTRSVESLEEARRLLRAGVDRSRDIQNYWRSFPAPFWREHWRRFTQANEMPSLPPPAPLLEAERTLIAQLDAGNFSAAANEGAPQLVTELRAALKETISVVRKKRLAQELRFQERSSPCGAAVAPDRNRATPQVVGGPPVESFYPQASVDRGDEGSVVLRLRISDSGCVRAGAILVHSGFDELDAAALRWMETAEYSPGFKNGRAVAGLTNIKVRFTIAE